MGEIIISVLPHSCGYFCSGISNVKFFVDIIGNFIYASQIIFISSFLDGDT
jgi:hypothetical protein